MSEMKPNESELPALVVGAAVFLLVFGLLSAAMVPTQTGATSVQVNDFSVQGDSVTVADGISALQLSVSGDVEWSDAPGDVQTVEVRVFVWNPGSEDTPTIDSATHSVSGASGTQSFSLAGDVLSNSAWSSDDFKEGDSPKVHTDVMVGVEVDVSGDGFGQGTVERDTATVTVTYEDGGGDGGGGGGGGADLAVTVTASGGLSASE